MEGLLSPMHLVIVLVIALLVFGPKKLPEMGRSLGKGIREFRQATSGIKDELSVGLNEPAATGGTTEPAAAATAAAATIAATTVAAPVPESASPAVAEPEPGEPAPVDFTPPPAHDPEGEAAALAAYGIDSEGNPVGDRHVENPATTPTVYIDADGNEYHLTAPAAADAAQSNQAADEAPESAPDGTSGAVGN